MTEPERVSLSRAVAERAEAPKGLGRDGDEPLMQNRSGANDEPPSPTAITARDDFHSAVSVGEVNGDGRGPLNAMPPGGVFMDGTERGTEAPEFQGECLSRPVSPSLINGGAGCSFASREEFLAACAVELAACVAAERRFVA